MASLPGWWRLRWLCAQTPAAGRLERGSTASGGTGLIAFSSSREPLMTSLTSRTSWPCQVGVAKVITCFMCNCTGIIAATHTHTPHICTPSHIHPLHTVYIEATILRDMSRCRRAINDGQWEELASTVHGIAAKARRVVEVARSKLGGVASPEASVTRLEKGGRGSQPGVIQCLRLCSHSTPHTSCVL